LVKAYNNPVSFGKIGHQITHFHDVTGSIGSWNHIVFDGEGIFRSGNLAISRIECYSTNPDQDFMVEGLWDLFLMASQVFKGVSGGKSENSVLRHSKRLQMVESEWSGIGVEYSGFGVED
jgi:hypothetical protein